MNMTKKISALLMTGLMLITGCATPAPSTTAAPSTTQAQTTTASGTQGQTTSAPATTTAQKAPLVVGMEANYAPYNWNQPTDANGAVKIDGTAGYAGGFDVEVAKELAAVLGRDLVIKQIAWEGLIPALQNGAIDLIIAGMSETPERLESVDFTDPYYDSRFVMLVKKGSPYESATALADFSGAKIVGQKGTNYDRVIPQIPEVKHETPLGTVPLIIHAIASGVADGTVLDKPVGISVTLANPDLAMVEFTPENGFQPLPGIPTACSIALAKGNEELKTQINEYLASFTNDKRDALMETAVKNQP